jgi:ankyrin repeat protein
METGADPEAVTDAGVTALHFCAQWTDEPSRIECAELLVKAGADVNEETRSGETVLMIAAEHNLDRLVKWLVDRGADVNQADQQGNTALHHAMNARTEPRPAILEILMKAGADPLCPNAEGKTVASLAKKFKAEDPVRQLTRKRMKKGVAL